MTLGFKQQFPWKEPTYFREKILADTGIVTINGDNINPSGPILQDGFKPKIHTMRADPHNRWKAGRKIEMVYRGAGYKILDHFNEGIPELEKCVSVQKVKIEWFTFHMKGLPIMGTKDSTRREPRVIIDDIVFPSGCSQIRDLAKNDGFDSLYDFFKWFNKDFSGKIIHWTDLRY